MLNASFSAGTDALTASITIIRGHRLQRKVDICRIPLAVRISGHTNMVVNPGFMNLALVKGVVLAAITNMPRSTVTKAVEFTEDKTIMQTKQPYVCQ